MVSVFFQFWQRFGWSHRLGRAKLALDLRVRPNEAWLGTRIANTGSSFGGPVYKNGVRFFTFTLFFLSPQALKLDWITSLILILCLYHNVLATRIGHWSAYESCDDVLQMVAPVVGYRAVSPGGWVGNSTRVGFRIFTISDVSSSFGKASGGWVGNSTRVCFRFF